jgi:glycosyltransferase involved in cell wall biosynthesis
MRKLHFVSVLIPVYNGEKFLVRCLGALKKSIYKRFEIIVIDDQSTDASREISLANGAKVVTMEKRGGPAAARNLGSTMARGDILFFVDADVVIKPDSISRVVEDFQNHPEIAAVFGSYDEEPAEKNFFSQYKNLYHYFVHQRSNPEAATFWAGCGAVRTQAFKSSGGFDDKLYTIPSIEDIELGYRLRARGYRILLDKRLCCKHLKRWEFRSLLHADIFCRAIPWSKLMLERGGMLNDLNLQTRERVCTALVGLSILMIPLLFLNFRLAVIPPLMLCLIPILNHSLYGFFYRCRGLTFTAGVFVMQLLYYCYCGLTLSVCWFNHKLRGATHPGVGRAASRPAL